MPNILIVDDDETNKATLRKEFENLGNTVTLSASTVAVEAFENEVPDVVLMDFTTCREIAKSAADKILEFDHTACIFALSTTVEEGDKKFMYASGARAVVQRPELLTDQGEVDALMSRIFSACSELEHEKCVGCWQNGVFTDTTKPLT
ncbi:MAG: response regulator [Candidatus Kariarchaeaceae archaeon]